MRAIYLGKCCLTCKNQRFEWNPWCYCLLVSAVTNFKTLWFSQNIIIWEWGSKSRHLFTDNLLLWTFFIKTCFHLILFPNTKIYLISSFISLSFGWSELHFYTVIDSKNCVLIPIFIIHWNINNAFWKASISHRRC